VAEVHAQVGAVGGIRGMPQKKKATFTFPKHLNRPKEVHEVVREGDTWRPVGSMDPLREADRVVVEDGTVIKDRHA